MGRLGRFISFVFSVVFNNIKECSEGNDNTFYIMVFRGTFSGYSAASPGQLCPLVIPHSLTAQLPLNVDSLPDLGPNSAFDELPKDTTSAPVSSFIFHVSILVVQQV